MNTWLDKNRGVIFSLLLVITLAGVGIFYWRQPSQSPIEVVSATATAPPVTLPATQPTLTPTPTPAPVRVYITGAIAKSDVYFLPQGSIIKDAIEISGGFSPDADLTKINLALELKDQQQIHVPFMGEDDPPPAVQGGIETLAGEQSSQSDNNNSTSATGGVVNLNNASIEELDTLPGIGPAIAKRIIEYREGLGKFTSIEQITQVSGIGEATFAKIANSITVD